MAVAVFHIGHTLDDAGGTVRHGDAVAELDQAVILVVVKGLQKRDQAPFVLRRNIMSADIGIHILFRKGMGQADPGRFLIAEAHEIVVAVDGMGEVRDALPPPDVVEHTQDAGLFRIDVMAAQFQAFGNGLCAAGCGQGVILPGAGIALPALFQKLPGSIKIRNHITSFFAAEGGMK